MNTFDRALGRVHREYGRVLLLVEAVLALGVVVDLFGASQIPASMRSAIWAAVVCLACASTVFVLYKIWRYAREDPQSETETAPAWRVILLVLILGIAIASVWWAPKVFQ